ncbi:MAG: S8 family serine peptidase [Woeseiaceae bacterium]|nr:S8 family serine peptidase [Woeseiaceae bacterium]
MKSLSSRTGSVARFIAIAAAFLALPAAATAADFVLTAAKWGKAQDRAVAAAGGTIVWSHRDAGIAAVSSDDPGFLARVSKDRAFKSAAEDMMVEWQDPEMIERSHIVPEAEFFYGLGWQWNMEAIRAPEAWAADCTGAGVRIAIIDGGIDPTHPDLAPNMDTTCSASFVPGLPYDTDVGSFWHGMHVAGIAAAANSGWGVIGVAPEATLISVKALHGGSGSFAWVIGAILYSSDPGAFGAGDCAKADIINMSLGATFFKRGGAGFLIGALNRAVNYAASKGTLVVSSAGNNGLDLGQAFDITSVPAESGSGLAITATGPDDLVGDFGPPGDPRRLASYTNWGEGTTYVAAPGGDFGTTAKVIVNSPGSIAGNKRAAGASYGPSPAGETGDVALWTDPVDTTGDPHDACEGGVDPGVAGKIALIHRGSCRFDFKSAQAEASGAVGVMIANNIPGAGAIGLGGAGAFAIPSVGISYENGATLEANLGAPVNATLVDNFIPGVLDQVISSCKAGWCFAVGTSMASPAAAGVAALIKGANPDISLGALKTKLAQTADDEGPIGHDEFYGHGFVNAARACGLN